MKQIYAIDSTRITHQEYWWGNRSPLVLIGWIIKWLRLRIPSSTDDPNFESTTPWIVESLPADVMQRFTPLASELAALGFYDVAYHCFTDSGTQTTIYWATFLHESGTHFARIHHRIWGRSQKVSRAIFPVFLTGYTDGSFLVSSAGKPDMLTPPSVRMNRMPAASAEKLWASHQQQAAAYGAQRTPLRIGTEAGALAATEQLHLLLRDFNLARGVFRPRSEDEQAAAERFASSVAQARADGLQHAEVLAELDLLQRHKPGWGNTLWILLISIIVFLAIGAARWDWKFTLWLIPALLFHETGHWIAMRIFRYRNLRMFFIPLFGAAVTGRHWNVPGWKKCIVSLAGPLPGIALGSALAVIALLTNTAWLNELAFLLLILNGFNLLPVLPLDGGHVLHATLFCRNRWLDIAFRCAAIVGMLLLGFSGLGQFLLFIAIMLAIGLPVAFKLGKVVDLMRRAQLPPSPPESDSIPVGTAQAIINALKAEQPRGLSNRILAQQTLNARPPGVPATLALLAAHGGAFFVCLVFCSLLVLGKFGGGLGGFFSSAMRQPQHAVDCRRPVETWRGAESGTPGATRNLLVATLSRKDSAAEVFSNLTRRLPATARLSLFGDSLLLSMPAEDGADLDRWLRALQAHDMNAFAVLSNQPVAMSLSFIAPDEASASNLAREIAACTAVPGLDLIPPWSPEARTPRYTNSLQERLVWLRLNESRSGFRNEPAVEKLSNQLVLASRQGVTNEVVRLSNEMAGLLMELQVRRRMDLRRELAGTRAEELINLHARLETMNSVSHDERTALLREIGRHLGEAVDAGLDTGLPRSVLQFSTEPATSGLIVELSWCRIANPQAVLPQFLAWLHEHRCTSVKYEFHQDHLFEGFDENSETGAGTPPR